MRPPFEAQPSTPGRSVSAEALTPRGFLVGAAAAVEAFFLEPVETEPVAEGALPVERRPLDLYAALAEVAR